MENVTAYDHELNYIINSLYKTEISSPAEHASKCMVLMTLRSFQNGKHPIINYHDFRTNTIPIPNMTIINPKTNQYVGVHFPTNTRMALDLFSINKNFNSRYFVSEEEIKRFKLDKYLDHDKLISVVLYDKYSDKAITHNSVTGNKQVMKCINVASLIKPKGPLSDKDFIKYFPDFDKQITQFNQYSHSLNKTYKDNMGNAKVKTTISNMKERSITNSPLPKLTQELIEYEKARILGREYKRQFSKEDHLKDMIELFKKDPQALSSAIKEAGRQTDLVISQMFSRDLMTRLNQTISINEQKKEDRQITSIQQKSFSESQARAQVRLKARARV